MNVRAPDILSTRKHIYGDLLNIAICFVKLYLFACSQVVYIPVIIRGYNAYIHIAIITHGAIFGFSSVQLAIGFSTRKVSFLN